jgi:hypothetical protein
MLGKPIDLRDEVLNKRKERKISNAKKIKEEIFFKYGKVLSLTNINTIKIKNNFTYIQTLDYFLDKCEKQKNSTISLFDTEDLILNSYTRTKSLTEYSPSEMRRYVDKMGFHPTWKMILMSYSKRRS